MQHPTSYCDCSFQCTITVCMQSFENNNISCYDDFMCNGLFKLLTVTQATGIQPDLVRPYLRVFIGSQPLCSIESISESQVVCRPVNITEDPYATPTLFTISQYVSTLCEEIRSPTVHVCRNTISLSPSPSPGANPSPWRTAGV